jgi:hypothetical protein
MQVRADELRKHIGATVIVDGRPATVLKVEVWSWPVFVVTMRSKQYPSGFARRVHMDQPFELAKS